MAVSRRVAEFMKASSWIRRMFEQGERLKREHGADNVYDFSLGNPDLPPPGAFTEALRAVADEPPQGKHCYMPNPGFPETRERVARLVQDLHGIDPGPKGTLMTVGAAGALNVALKALLDQGTEVIVLSPYFPEYRFYIDNHGGVVVPVPTQADFDLDIEAIEAALTDNTRAIILNSPNNPTGRVYSASKLRELGELVDRKAPDATIICDEPYRRIAYDGVEVASILNVTHRSLVAASFSKDLGLAGERIGFLAAHPDHPDHDALLGAAVFANRTLGYVNAPALMQRVLTRLGNVTVDIATYEERRNVFLQGLRDAGYECVKPEGAFYLFPRTPIEDDVAFVQELYDERILAVPGSGFGTPGHFRLSYAVPLDVIHRSLPGFARVLERLASAD